MKRGTFYSIYEDLFPELMEIFDAEDTGYYYKKKDESIEYYIPCVGLSKDDIKVGMRDGKIEIKLNFKDDPLMGTKEEVVRITPYSRLDLDSLKATVKNGLLTLKVKDKELKTVDIKIE